MKSSMVKIKKTSKVYGLLWERSQEDPVPQRWHFNDMQELIPEPIVRGAAGIDIGSGCGYDTYIMAKDNPAVKIISLELSDGIYQSRRLTAGLRNISLIQGSALQIPLKSDTLDFAYSFGVLHHTFDPEQGIREISRVIKKDGRTFLYFYEDHSDNFIKYFMVKAVKMVRLVTTRLAPEILYLISFLLSPLMIIMFSFPARALKRFKKTSYLADKMPFNFGKVITKMLAEIEKAGAKAEDWMGLSDHTSKWNMDLYVEVDREIPGAENVSLSGKFFSKVYEGAFKETGQWCKDFETLVKSKGMEIKKLYMWYTTCPKCVKKYGKNYVVVIGKIE